MAGLVRAVIGFRTILVADEALLLRALDLCEQGALHFAESDLTACAELSGVGTVASFDRAIDRVTAVERPEPAEYRPPPGQLGRASRDTFRVHRVPPPVAPRTELGRVAPPAP